MDVSLIVIAAVVPFFLLFFNAVVLGRYLDASATRGHYFTKFMMMLGMLLAECTVLLLPLDVGNRAGVIGCGFWNNNCGGLNLALVWQIAYMIIFGLVVVVFPFFIFFYEADDEGMLAEDKARAAGGSTFLARLCDFRGCFSALLSAVCYTTVTLVIALAVLLACYFTVAKTSIPYSLTSIDVASNAFRPTGTLLSDSCNPADSTCLRVCGRADGSCRWNASTITMDVTFIIYTAALMSFVGWFVFSIYLGIGFVALPLDCFNAFRYRPRPLGYTELEKTRKNMRDRCQELIKVANEILGEETKFSDGAHSRSERRKRARMTGQELNRYRVLVDMLELDLEKYQMSDPKYYRDHFNPLVPYAKLLFGIISVVISAVWFIHIIIYMLFNPPLHPFLNNYLTWFDQWFPLFGTLTVAVFGLYLLLAVAKGNAKFGTRFFLIKVHPLETGKTLLNSFAFNIALVLLCVLPATQFCTEAFSQYARLTDADLIFGNQFKYMQGMTVLWRYNVFLFVILIMTVLSLIYFSVCPSDKAHLQRVMDEIKRKNKQQLKSTTDKLARYGGNAADARV